MALLPGIGHVLEYELARQRAQSKAHPVGEGERSIGAGALASAPGIVQQRTSEPALDQEHARRAHVLEIGAQHMLHHAAIEADLVHADREADTDPPQDFELFARVADARADCGERATLPARRLGGAGRRRRVEPVVPRRHREVDVTLSISEHARKLPELADTCTLTRA